MHQVGGTLLVAIVVLALSASPAAVAAECDYETNETDKFTKVRTVRTDWALLTSAKGGDAKTYTYISALTEGDAHYLSVKISAYKYTNYRPRDYQLEDIIVVPEGARLRVLMADGTIVDLHNSRPESAESSYTEPGNGPLATGDYTVTSEIAMGYTLDAATASALLAQQASRIRVETADGNRDVELHKISRDDIRNAIRCTQEPS